MMKSRRYTSIIDYGQYCSKITIIDQKQQSTTHIDPDGKVTDEFTSDFYFSLTNITKATLDNMIFPPLDVIQPKIVYFMQPYLEMKESDSPSNPKIWDATHKLQIFGLDALSIFIQKCIQGTTIFLGRKAKISDIEFVVLTKNDAIEYCLHSAVKDIKIKMNSQKLLELYCLN